MNRLPPEETEDEPQLVFVFFSSEFKHPEDVPMPFSAMLASVLEGEAPSTVYEALKDISWKTFLFWYHKVLDANQIDCEPGERNKRLTWLKAKIHGSESN